MSASSVRCAPLIRFAAESPSSKVTSAGPTRAGSGEIWCSIVIVREEPAGLEQPVIDRRAAQMHHRILRHFFGSGRSPLPRKADNILRVPAKQTGRSNRKSPALLIQAACIEGFWSQAQVQTIFSCSFSDGNMW